MSKPSSRILQGLLRLRRHTPPPSFPAPPKPSSFGASHRFFSFKPTSRNPKRLNPMAGAAATALQHESLAMQMKALWNKRNALVVVAGAAGGAAAGAVAASVMCMSLLTSIISAQIVGVIIVSACIPISIGVAIFGALIESAISVSIVVFFLTLLLCL